MEVPKDQMASLLENGLFDSAQMLGCFLVSSTVTNVEASPYLKAENLVSIS
ncbi:Anaphase-promoting complex subunit 7 [Dendrobium catenatum]|uniref:Anaphase-promoting complex subunit 7 n=1 Tax=Dendrobium catenatum TaxID=906689 RepID=A0A2I0VGL7_9ASPA|nr:Anaphase-promoting complex subunit 7 [Dendrobium catenatum]